MKILEELPLRHKEKVTKKQLALEFLKSESVLNSDGVPEGWAEYLAEINLEVDTFVHEALEKLEHKSN